jgi:hypothetical protein
MPSYPPTAFARISPRHAAVVVAVTIATTLFFVAVTFSPLKSGFADAPSRGPGDVKLYQAEIARMQQGEGFYAASAAELKPRGYPTRSLFNWRTPLPVALVGMFADVRVGQAFLGAAALLLMFLAFDWLCRECGTHGALLGMLLLTGALLPVALDELFVMPEIWSGVLIALSVAAYAQGRGMLGLLVGLAALFCRELAAPYCLLCLAIALRQKNWREVAGWFGGFAAYGVFYALHVRQVLPLIGRDDVAHVHGWVRLGGAGFVISTAQMNAYLLLLPQWVTALVVSAALLGVAAWNSPAGERLGLTLAGYLVAFSIVGQDFNQYWGSMIAPLFCLAAARFPAALADLAASLRSRPSVVAGGLGSAQVSGGQLNAG